MSIYNSKQWLMDLDDSVSNIPELDVISGATLFITGATGLIGSAVVDTLLRYNERHPDREISVIAAGRSQARFRERFQRYVDSPWLRYYFYDANDPVIQDIDFDYFIHGAGVTMPVDYISSAVETLTGNIIGMKALLDCARKSPHFKRGLYISSSEVYGQKAGNEPYREDQYGSVDPLSLRNSYAVGKRATEALCAAYASEYGVDMTIVRPGHIYGPAASPSDSRLSAVWTRAAARGENIVMKSDGSQIRSYCHCLDCASALLKVLIKGEGSRAYNISNPDSIISIRQMAGILCDVAHVALQLDAPPEAERRSFNPMQNSSLDSTALEALGWRGHFDARRGFSHTIAVLKDMQSDSPVK